MSYPDNWDAIRRQIYRRDGYTCQNCGAKNTELHAHHIVPKSKGGSDSPSNLVTVCKDCHEDIHGHAIGGQRQQKKHTFEFAMGVIIGIALSIAVPPFAPIGIIMAFICFICLITEGGEG